MSGTNKRKWKEKFVKTDNAGKIIYNYVPLMSDLEPEQVKIYGKYISNFAEVSASVCHKLKEEKRKKLVEKADREYQNRVKGCIQKSVQNLDESCGRMWEVFGKYSSDCCKSESSHSCIYLSGNISEETENKKLNAVPEFSVDNDAVNLSNSSSVNLPSTTVDNTSSLESSDIVDVENTNSVNTDTENNVTSCAAKSQSSQNKLNFAATSGSPAPSDLSVDVESTEAISFAKYLKSLHNLKESTPVHKNVEICETEEPTFLGTEADESSKNETELSCSDVETANEEPQAQPHSRLALHMRRISQMISAETNFVSIAFRKRNK